MERPLRFIVSFAWMTYISLVAAPPFGRETMSNTAQNDHFSSPAFISQSQLAKCSWELLLLCMKEKEGSLKWSSRMDNAIGARTSRSIIGPTYACTMYQVWWKLVLMNECQMNREPCYVVLPKYVMGRCLIQMPSSIGSMIHERKTPSCCSSISVRKTNVVLIQIRRFIIFTEGWIWLWDLTLTVVSVQAFVLGMLSWFPRLMFLEMALSANTTPASRLSGRRKKR